MPGFTLRKAAPRSAASAQNLRTAALRAPSGPPPERPAPRPEPRPERPAPPPPPREQPAPRPEQDQRRPEPPAPRQPAQERPPQPERPAQERRPAPEREERPQAIPPHAAPAQPNPPSPAPPSPGPQRPAPQQQRAPELERAPPPAAPPRPEPGREAPAARPPAPVTPPAPPPVAPARPVQRLDAEPGLRLQPNAGPAGEPGRPLPPNVAPGVPGRPVQAPPGPAPGPNLAPGAGPGRPPAPNMAPGLPGRPFQPPGLPPAPGQIPPPPPPSAGPSGRTGGNGFNVPGQPGYVPGGFRPNDDARSFGQVQRDRQSFDEGGRTYIREPGRIIVQDRNTFFIRHDENERFRDLDPRGYRFERRGPDFYSYIDRPGGEQIVTITDDDGRLLRRYRRFPDGREVVIIDDTLGGPPLPIYQDVVVLPPPLIRIPRDRYVVEYEGADEETLYETLVAPPVMALDRRYTLDQVRYSPDLRARMRSIDIDTITFDTASFAVTPDQAARLSGIAAAINRAIRANPQEVFLIEGYTDAVGQPIDNLSLSDRRAQSVATVLTQSFGVPPENLTTQGYGQQYLKVNTPAPSRENRRVTVRRITPLLQQGQPAPR